MSESKGWTHVAMTNPQCGSDGSKTLDIYINGVYKKSKAITIPSDAEITDAKLIFGGMADNTMVPTDASYGGIQVYRGTLTAAEISALYNSQKDMFTPMEGKISLEVYGKDGTVQDGYINYPDLSDGMEAKLCIDNPNGGSDINARLYSAVKDGTGLKEAYVSEPITVEDGELGYAENFDFDDIFSALTPGDEVSFYLWTDELTPLTEEKSFYIKNMLFNETDGCRLIIHTNVIPRAESLVPEAFTITDPAEAYTADRVIYYPLTNEIHIIIDDAKGISLPCRVRARLKDRSGTPFNLDVKAEISSLYDIPVYSDGIKYLSVTKDGSAAGSVITESGNYTIETGAVIQQRDRTAPAQIVVYKQSGETTAKIAGKSVSCTDDDVVFTVSCRLKAGDRVYAVIE